MNLSFRLNQPFIQKQYAQKRPICKVAAEMAGESSGELQRLDLHLVPED